MGLQPGKGVNWGRLGEPRFVRVMEAVIRAEFPESEVQVVDGRGGDGGVDVLIEDDTQVTVVQLKYYKEGFDGRWWDRRSKIRQSLLKARETVPEMSAWVLAVPARPTRTGWTFIKSLGEIATDFKVVLWDRPKLDQLCAKHQGIVNALARDEDYIKEEIKALNVEQAVLARTEDLTERVGRLGALANDLDPDWAFDFGISGGVTNLVIRPKHAGSDSTSPITLTPTLDFTRHAELREEARRFFGFGHGQSVRLPREVITSLTVDGPAWFSPMREADWLEFGRTSATDLPDVRIQVTDREGKKRTHVAKPVQVGAGSEGVSLTMRLYGHVDLVLLLPEDRTAEVSGTIAMAVEGANSTDARRSVSFVRQYRNAARVDLDLVDGRAIASLLTAQPLATSDDDTLNLSVSEEFAADLETIEDHTGLAFTFPSVVTPQERVDARMLGQLLAGGVVKDDVPFSFDMSFSTVPTEPELAPLLNGQPIGVKVSQDDVSWPLLDQVVELDQLAWFHPAARIDLEDDEQLAPECMYVLKSDDGTPARLYLPRKVDPNQRLVAEKWELIGIPEPPI